MDGIVTPAAVTAAAMPARRRSIPWLKFWPIYPALLFLAVFFIYPTTLLLGLSVQNGHGQYSMEQYSHLFRTDLYTEVLLITLKIAAWTTILAVIAGYPVAYLLATVKRSTRNRLIIWVLLPLWTSFLVRTFAWIVLLGRHGAVNQLLTALHLVDYPVRMLYDFTGVMIGMVHALMPLCVLTMLAVMENIDLNLGRAAATLGEMGFNVLILPPSARAAARPSGGSTSRSRCPACARAPCSCSSPRSASSSRPRCSAGARRP